MEASLTYFGSRGKQYLAQLRREAADLRGVMEYAEDMGQLEVAERYQKRLIDKLRMVDIVKARIGYHRPWPLVRALNTWGNGGYGEKYTRKWRRVRYEYADQHRCNGPKRRRVTASFPMSLFDYGEILPYPGVYEVWTRKLPRWLANRWRKKGKHLVGRYLYIER